MCMCVCVACVDRLVGPYVLTTVELLRPFVFYDNTSSCITGAASLWQPRAQPRDERQFSASLFAV